MNTKKRKKVINLKKFQYLVQKKLNLDKFKINPVNVIDDTKKKIGSFYTNLKKERAKEKKRLENIKKIEEKREVQRQKKQEQKERLNKIKEEKRQILAQKKLLLP